MVENRDSVEALSDDVIRCLQISRFAVRYGNDPARIRAAVGAVTELDTLLDLYYALGNPRGMGFPGRYMFLAYEMRRKN